MKGESQKQTAKARWADFVVAATKAARGKRQTATTRTGAIDWKDLHARLDEAWAKIEASLSLSPEEAQVKMEERAGALARVPPRPPHADEVLEVATFILANERYALETRHIREVVRFSEFTPVPGAPDFLVGLLNLRGEVLAVFDLRKFFGVPYKGVSDLSRVIVLGGERAELGVLADGAHEVMTLRIDEVFEPPGSVAGIGREYLRGVTKDALIVLDGAALLQATQLFIDQGEETVL